MAEARDVVVVHQQVGRLGFVCWSRVLEAVRWLWFLWLVRWIVSNGFDGRGDLLVG